MTESSPLAWLLFSLSAATLVLTLFRRLRTRTGRPLPPGPPGLPLIGNALQMPAKYEWIKFREWGEQYGDVVHISAFGRPIIILNSATATFDLLDKKGALYADRPIFPMAGELVGYTDSVPLSPANSHHRESRKLMSSALAPRKIEQVRSIQEEKTHGILLNLLLESPDRFLDHIRKTVAATVFLISHGYNIAPQNDPLIQLAEQANDEFAAAASPGAFLVDVFPILKYVPEWFPGASFKTKARQWRQTTIRLRDEPYDAIKRQIKEGTALPSFTASLIEQNAHPTAEEENIYKWASVAFYSGGADTTVSAISSFFLAMALYPDVQKKAQAEIDRVVGPSRLPTFADRTDLPYLAALLKEVLRWNPVAPIAIPHRLLADDEYRGFHLPAGALVFANSWAILRDPALYPAPHAFQPERYLSAGADAQNPDPATFAFGYGRRVCPGQHLASANLFITAAMTLAAFDIAPARDAHGQPVPPAVKYTPSIISHPEPFRCRVTPRSAAAANLVRAAKA